MTCFGTSLISKFGFKYNAYRIPLNQLIKLIKRTTVLSRRRNILWVEHINISSFLLFPLTLNNLSNLLNFEIK